MKLSIEGVGKQYRGNFWGLKGFSLELEPGVLGLLGPNGAGKSTLMRILATITRPTEGRVTWDGADIVREPDRLRAVLGYLPQDFAHRRAAGPGQPDRSAQAPAGRLLRRHEAAHRHRAGPAQRSEAPHRGRADRGPRSRGAGPLPQPPLGPGRRADHHPLDPHRLGPSGR